MKNIFKMSQIYKTNNLTNTTKYFSHTESYKKMKEALSSKLFEISLKDKCVTKQALGLIYTPGVGEACKKIQADPSRLNIYTNRKNSIAIISDGGIFGVESKKVFPLMDWLIVQIKYYSGLDAYPFAINKDSNIEQTIKDLGNSFETILLLEDRPKVQVDSDVRVVNQKEISRLFTTSIVDAQISARLIAFLVKQRKFGWITEAQLKEGVLYEPTNLRINNTFRSKLQGHTIQQNSLRVHEFYQGKIQIELNFFDIHKLKPYFSLENILKATQQSQLYSKSKNLCAIVTDGTSILGFGNIGPRAGLPVMEGKSCLFKHLGGVQVVPVCVNPKKTSEQQIISIKNLIQNFAGVNLEDITAPNCFKIQEGLKQFNFPVFHDDQHGTAIIVLAGLINASKVIHKPLEKCKIVINGAGAAGITIAKLLIAYGADNIIVCDTKGSIYQGRPVNMNSEKQQVARITNKKKIAGNLEHCLEHADIFVGVSHADALHGQWISKMHKKNIIFALANPHPQILPDDAKKHGAYLVATGRSDFYNQINNSLVFPGIFRAILEHNIKSITMQMKIAASLAIAQSVHGQVSLTNIVPQSLDKDIALTISQQIGKTILKAKL